MRRKSRRVLRQAPRFTPWTVRPWPQHERKPEPQPVSVSTLDPMDWQYDSQSFPFLDLPPELRNIVYQYYLQDSYSQDYQLDISQWRSLAPGCSITAVSRQIRSEVLGYYRSALADFFKTHLWYLNLTASLRQDHVRDAVLSTVHAVPKVASIRELQFSARSFKYTSRRGPISFIMNVTVDNGKPVWNFRALNCPSLVPVFLLRAWLDKLNRRVEEYKIALVKPDSVELNVGNCLQVVMGKFSKDDDHFDDIAMFFQD